MKNYKVTFNEDQIGLVGMVLKQFARDQRRRRSKEEKSRGSVSGSESLLIHWEGLAGEAYSMLDKAEEI